MSTARSPKQAADNSDAERKPIGRPFAPGQSGNPGGRPKGMVEYQKLVRERCGPGAVAALEDAVEKREPWAIKIAIEYAAGKPMQAVEMSGKSGGPIQTQAVQDAVGRLSQEERLALLALYRKAGLKLPGEV